MKPRFARQLKAIFTRFLRFSAAATHVPHNAPGEEFGDAFASFFNIGMDGAGEQWCHEGSQAWSVLTKSESRFEVPTGPRSKTFTIVFSLRPDDVNAHALK
jgi:hypothetical protein